MRRVASFEIREEADMVSVSLCSRQGPSVPLERTERISWKSMVTGDPIGRVTLFEEDLGYG